MVLSNTVINLFPFPLYRVFRTMFKEVKPSSGGIGRLSSPLLRRRVPTVNHQYMSPPNSRRTRILGIGRLKKKMSVPDNIASKVESNSDSTSSGGVGATPTFADDPRNTQIKEQVNFCLCFVQFKVTDWFSIIFN